MEFLFRTRTESHFLTPSFKQRSVSACPVKQPFLHEIWQWWLWERNCPPCTAAGKEVRPALQQASCCFSANSWISAGCRLLIHAGPVYEHGLSVECCNALPCRTHCEPPSSELSFTEREPCVRISYGWSLTSLFISYLWDERTVKRQLETIKSKSCCDLSGI